LEIIGVRYFKKDKTSFVERSEDFKDKLYLNKFVIVEFDNKTIDLAKVIYIGNSEKKCECSKSNSKPHSKHKKNAIPKIIDFADKNDFKQKKYVDEKAKDALYKCNEQIKKHKLEMFLLDSHYTIDKTKLTFYFTSEGRVDFRNLVKDLAYIFKTRIELLQVGVRDKSKKIGGLGVCGREICCSSFLHNFNSVSIKMAKNQMLNLIPSKISGCCGRLLCCLAYENDFYIEELKNYPPAECYLRIGDKTGRIINYNLLKKTVTYTIGKGYTNEITLNEFLEQYKEYLIYPKPKNNKGERK